MRITDVGGYLESEERKRQVKRDRELFAYGKEDRTHVEYIPMQMPRKWTHEDIHSYRVSSYRGSQYLLTRGQLNRTAKSQLPDVFRVPVSPARD